MVRRGIGVLFCVCCLTGSVVGQHIVNVAIGKTYNQSSKWNTWPSSNAANNNTGGVFGATNCIHTLEGPNLWWEVDLGRTYPVHDITVWARTGLDNQHCVNVTSAPNSRNKSVTCSSVMYGRKVRLTYKGTNPALNLCEFQIFVPSGVSQCPAGHHGAQCGQTCSDNCGGGPDNNFCYQDTGACYGGCQPGYHGDQCTSPCSSLSSRCTQCSQDGTCTACTGHFMIPACTACEGGLYKANDNTCNPCSSTCQRSCDTNTGRCNGCRDGRYGNMCAMPCSPGCARCDQNSGNCTACDSNSNLMFPGCSECEDGYYKQTAPPCIQCPGTCDNNTPCDKTTGHCDKCPPGRKGETCMQECDGGQYGPSRCSLSCGQCQNGTQCHVKTGQCPLCEPGFYPPLCTKACDDNTYGQNCSESCGQCKGGQPCNTATGSCTTGCEPGYIGELCNHTCEEGLYGERCNKTCSNCQVNTTCHHQHGQCLVGCAPGFSGNLCDAERTEQPYSTAFIVGVIVGVLFIVVFAAVLIVVISWCRRSSEEIEENHQHVVTPVEPESTQDRDRPSSASPISDEDTTVYEIIDNDDAEEMHVQENTYESPHPYSNDDADRALYMQLSPPASDDASKVNIELS